jgi:hypothetical protein
MNQFKRNALRKIMEEKRKEKEAIKALDLDPLIKRVNEKRKPEIDVESLPF